MEGRHPRPDGAAASFDWIGIGPSSRHLTDLSLLYAPSSTPTVAAVADDPQPRKRSASPDALRTVTLEELLEEACLPQICEAIRAKGDASAIDLAEASWEELDALVQIVSTATVSRGQATPQKLAEAVAAPAVPSASRVSSGWHA